MTTQNHDLPPPYRARDPLADSTLYYIDRSLFGDYKIQLEIRPGYTTPAFYMETSSRHRDLILHQRSSGLSQEVAYVEYQEPNYEIGTFPDPNKSYMYLTTMTPDGRFTLYDMPNAATPQKFIWKQPSNPVVDSEALRLVDQQTGLVAAEAYLAPDSKKFGAMAICVSYGDIFNTMFLASFLTLYNKWRREGVFAKRSTAEGHRFPQLTTGDFADSMATKRVRRC